MTEDIISHALLQDVILFICEWVAGYFRQKKPTLDPLSILVVADGGRNKE